MLWMRFESTIPASERAKTVHTLDRSATVTGNFTFTFTFIKQHYVTYHKTVIQERSFSGVL
jgi:hypothetical protein